MAIKLADTLKPMGDFPALMAEDLNLTKSDGKEKSLQKMYEEGELGGNGLPVPETKDKLLVSVENEESELEWQQVDKSIIDGSFYDNIQTDEDLNTFVKYGTYKATTKRIDRIHNLPIEIAGMLTVKPTGSVIYQTYKTVQNEVYTRTSENVGENWTEWVNISVTSNDSVLTQAITTNVECGGIPFGTNFEVGTPLEDIFEKLLVKYINPSVSLKLSVGSLRAKWSPLTSVTLTTSGSKGTSDIADIKLYDGSTLIETQTAFGAYSYAPATSISSNTTFKAIVSDVQGKTSQATSSVSFVIPYYYGVSTSASLADPTTLIEDVSSKGNKTYRFTTSARYFYFAYDYSYGSLTSILDGSGFENLGNFTKVGKVTVTKNGNNYDLMVYRSNTVQTQTNFSLTFKL